MNSVNFRYGLVLLLAACLMLFSVTASANYNEKTGIGLTTSISYIDEQCQNCHSATVTVQAYLRPNLIIYGDDTASAVLFTSRADQAVAMAGSNDWDDNCMACGNIGTGSEVNLVSKRLSI